MRLAGTYHPIPYLLERITHYLPGVTETNALWMGYDSELYTSNDVHPLRDYLKVQGQQLRLTNVTSEWTSTTDLFSTSNQNLNQLSLADEDRLNVLKLFFTSPVDQKKDILVIEFPPNVFLKSLNTEFKGINAQEKHILSHVLISILSAEYKRAYDEMKLLKQIERINKQQAEKVKELKENLRSTELLYSSAIGNIVGEFKTKLEKELGKEFIFDETVIYKLAKERLTIIEIENTVHNAIYLAYNLNLSEQQIRVNAEHIQLNQESITPVSVKPSIDTRQKTSVLLDRYESAAEKVKSNGKALNGKNIAAMMDPPVTPPAITDAVKKNKTKIAYLLKQYPNKWGLTRVGIRPIKELCENTRNAQAI
ncbi:hypothetical protein CW751_03870 [Brumimicrobium salinarum]|uniref:Uncharacterized protein n=1 Tax=Brumimicrobium salinarum TaxID=2058658 RepID=A0A2I0R515_9FLAO|nr:hypothetical protein [Brumimicrobium salinarum]PKR81673.1 hypothetical protein CW751_03870 [Brumimicrobium salinarum]